LLLKTCHRILRASTGVTVKDVVAGAGSGRIRPPRIGMTPFAAIPQRERDSSRRTKPRIDPPERRSEGVKNFFYGLIYEIW
jgi:hypothetical protein